MTTPSSPDGLPPTPGSPGTPPTTGTPEGGEPIRNWDDVRKVIVSRDEFKASTQALETTMAAIAAKLDALGRPPAGPTSSADEPAVPTGIEAQVKQLADVVGGLVGDKTNEAKQQRRKAITDAVVAAANEASRDLVRGQLATLALDGDVDLHAEQTQAEVDKALAKMRAANPGYFTLPPNPQGTTGGGHDLIPHGVALHELTAEQLARLSDEDFSKARKAARTSRLAV